MTFVFLGSFPLPDDHVISGFEIYCIIRNRELFVDVADKPCPTACLEPENSNFGTVLYVGLLAAVFSGAEQSVYASFQPLHFHPGARRLPPAGGDRADLTATHQF
jgi:hypothetical protein